MKESRRSGCGGMPPPEAPLGNDGGPGRRELHPSARPVHGPMFAWTGGGDGKLRDTSKPIAFDANGNPLYAPRGFLLRLPWR
jgi:hypothetical protein